MRIQCTFDLFPETHEQHQFAITNLLERQKREKKQENRTEVVKERQRIFHRDIYLSGLYLSQLSADLPPLIARLYKPDTISSERMLQELNKHLAIADEEASYARLTDDQWQKLNDLLAQYQPENPPVTEHVTQQAAPEVSEQLNVIEQQQQLLIERIEALAVTTRSEASQPADSQSNEQLLSVIEDNQLSLMRELQSVKSQLKKITKGGLAAVTVDKEEPQVDLDVQLERAQRIKSKQLW